MPNILQDLRITIDYSRSAQMEGRTPIQEVRGSLRRDLDNWLSRCTAADNVDDFVVGFVEKNGHLLKDVILEQVDDQRLCNCFLNYLFRALLEAGYPVDGMRDAVEKKIASLMRGRRVPEIAVIMKESANAAEV